MPEADEILFRQATEADLPGVITLYAQPDFDDGRVLDDDEAAAIFCRFARYPDYTLHVAVLGDEVVGTFALLVMDNLGHRGAASAIAEDVVVRTSLQGHGIGRRMMAYALDLAREKGCYKLALSSNVRREAAHAFYEGLGFERHGYSFRVQLDRPLP